jgi:hypothetical protein
LWQLYVVLLWLKLVGRITVINAMKPNKAKHLRFDLPPLKRTPKSN